MNVSTAIDKISALSYSIANEGIGETFACNKAFADMVAYLKRQEKTHYIIGRISPKGSSYVVAVAGW